MSELVCLYVRIGQCVRVCVSVCPYMTVSELVCLYVRI